MAFSKFTVLCNYYHHLLPRHIHMTNKKKNLYFMNYNVSMTLISLHLFGILLQEAELKI